LILLALSNILRGICCSHVADPHLIVGLLFAIHLSLMLYLTYVIPSATCRQLIPLLNELTIYPSEVSQEMS
jgi:hypothetical protein